MTQEYIYIYIVRTRGKAIIGMALQAIKKNYNISTPAFYLEFGMTVCFKKVENTKIKSWFPKVNIYNSYSNITSNKHCNSSIGIQLWPALVWLSFNNYGHVIIDGDHILNISFGLSLIFNLFWGCLTLIHIIEYLTWSTEQEYTSLKSSDLQEHWPCWRWGFQCCKLQISQNFD